MSYVLHYAPDNASLILRLTLEEMGQPYRTQLVDRSRGEQASAAYRALNPAGLIPALETPDGTLFETGAILLWLADRHGVMAPAPQDPARAAFLSWLFFVSNTLHTLLRMMFYTAKYAGPDTGAQRQLRHTITQADGDGMTLPRALSLLDARQALRDAAAAPDVLDYYIAALLRWCRLYPEGGNDWFDLRDTPALHARAAWLERRPAVAAAQAAEGLGPTPFTAPVHATPPEGSAT